MNLKTRFAFGIVPITILALLARAATATWTGLTTDEANGVMIAVTDSLSDMLHYLSIDGNAPFFYLILRACNFFVGHQGMALKFLAVAFASATVPISYWIFRLVLPRDICLAVATLLAFCPTAVAFGTLIRPYAIEGVFGLLSTFACVRVLSTATNIKRVIIYGITTALLVYTHYWGAFVPIGHVGLVLTAICRRWIGRKQFLYWFAGASLALLLFVPQIVSVSGILFGLKNDLSAFDVAPRPFALASDFFPFLILTKGRSENFRNVIFTVICNFSIFLTFISPAVMLCKKSDLKKEKDPEGDPDDEIVYDGRMWKAATIWGLAAAFIVDLFLPSLRWRYLMPFVPMVFVVFTTGFNALFSSRTVWVRLVVPTLIWVAMFIPFLSALPGQPDTTVNALVDKIENNADRSKDAVIIAWEIIAPTINFSLPQDIESISYPHIGRTVINHWPDMAILLRKQEVLEELLAKISKIVDRGGNIWLIDVTHTMRPLDYRNPDLIGNAPFMETTVRRSDQIRSWLVTHCKQVGKTQIAPGRDFNIMMTRFAPVGDDEKIRAALPKVDNLWKSVFTDQNDPEQTAEGFRVEEESQQVPKSQQMPKLPSEQK